MEWILLGYLMVGAVAGLLAGLLGVGGGLVIVPVLVWLFELQGFPAERIMHLAVGTSLATILLNGGSSVLAHHRRGAVRWDLVQQLSLGIVPGAMLGAMLAESIPNQGLRWFFGLFELVVALQMGLALIPDSHRNTASPALMAGAGGTIGGISALVGIGGGTMTVPFLAWRNVPMAQAVATSAACGLPIALAGTAGFVFTGWQFSAELPHSLGYVYWPAFLGITLAGMVFAPIGAALAHYLPARRLKRLFALILVALGIKMLWI